MSYLKLYDKKISDYTTWISTFDNHLELVEQNILQKDDSDIIVEKVVSVIFSSVFVTLGASIVALFGIATAGIGGVLLFIIGWGLSHVINRQVFGTEKSIENINDEDEQLLQDKQKLLDFFKSIKTKLKIRKHKKEVAFTRYRDVLNKLEAFRLCLQDYDVKTLAYKYRYRHSQAIKKNIILIHHFNSIYCQQQKPVKARKYRAL